MSKKEAGTGSAEQSGGRGRADARQGRQRGYAFPGPLNFSPYFGELLCSSEAAEFFLKGQMRPCKSK